LGGVPDASGVVTLDACVMLSPRRAAGVAGVRGYANVASIARKVMERTPHKLLVGPGAEAFAVANGFKPVELLTDAARRRWEELRVERTEAGRSAAIAEANRANREEEGGSDGDVSGSPRGDHDTVGVLAIDSAGTMAGACSTSGLAFKLPGRVGDSPIIGHGLYVDPGAGAATATGNGELMMGTCASFLAVERMRAGDSPLESIREVLRRVARSYDLSGKEQCAMIALRPDGQWAAGALRAGFKFAVTTREGERLLDPELVRL
jgi:isoaspartyl peptidase/L-asparaginase-like protein (Ntn-hydrolase superfamily)